ncbi:MAG: alpha/beta hydrolase [Terriglobia bacterium]|nr:MAG: alpha/beta hydrolase [Terriglobia bacterium]
MHVIRQLVFLVFGAAWAFAQNPTIIGAEPQVIPLWERDVPGALGSAAADRPFLTYYPPAPAGRATGTAVIIAPGGGYQSLAVTHEGVQEANWFNAMGIAAFVLQYRLGPRYHHPVELGDAQRAIRLVRARAKEWNLATDRIGMMGFSAGGHLAATAATHFDAGKRDAQDPIERPGSRPDFLILCYPVISFDSTITHAGSKRNLLGESPDPKLVEDLSNELRVTAQTPPTFIFHTTNDPAVPVENSVAFYRALNRFKVPAEMHLFENGPHGVGMALSDPALSIWPTLLSNWLRARGLLTRSSAPAP